MVAVFGSFGLRVAIILYALLPRLGAREFRVLFGIFVYFMVFYAEYVCLYNVPRRLVDGARLQPYAYIQ